MKIVSSKNIKGYVINGFVFAVFYLALVLILSVVSICNDNEAYILGKGALTVILLLSSTSFVLGFLFGVEYKRAFDLGKRRYLFLSLILALIYFSAPVFTDIIIDNKSYHNNRSLLNFISYSFLAMGVGIVSGLVISIISRLAKKKVLYSSQENILIVKAKKIIMITLICLVIAILGVIFLGSNPPKTPRSLAEIALNDKSGELSWYIDLKIWSYGEWYNTKSLIDLASSNDERDKYFALTALHFRKNNDLLPIYIANCSSKNKNIRCLCIDGFELSKDFKTIYPSVKEVLKVADYQEKCGIFILLWQFKANEREIIDILRIMAKDKDEKVRKSAYYYLEKRSSR